MDFSQYKEVLSKLSTSNSEVLNTATTMSIAVPSEEGTDNTLKFTIVNKNINTPIGMSNVLVQGDKLSRKIFFEMNRYFDGVDLSDKQFFINFINAENQSGTDDIVDLYVTDDKITFEWWVKSELTVLNGTVSIQLEIAEFDAAGDAVYRYATVPINLEVEKTINPDGIVDAPDYYLDIHFLNQYTEDITYNMASDTEPIKIENRSIVMPYLEDFLITQDSRSKILTFVMQRYVDNVDLSEKTIVIKFELPDGQGDRSFASNIAVSDTQIRFDWLLDSRTTLQDGKVTFAIEFIGYNEKDEFTCWNTLSSSIFVSKGLEVDSKIETPSASWIQSWNILADKYLKNFVSYMELVEGLSKRFEAATINIEKTKNEVENIVNSAESWSEIIREEVGKAEITMAEIEALKTDFNDKKADFDVKKADFDVKYDTFASISSDLDTKADKGHTHDVSEIYNARSKDEPITADDLSQELLEKIISGGNSSGGSNGSSGTGTGLTDEQSQKLDKIVTSGDGNKFLSDDGIYKEININIDDAMSDNSENPVKNNVIKAYIDNKEVKLSEETGNIIEKKEDGLYVTIPNNVDGIDISAEDKNAIVEKTDGWYVEDKTEDIAKLREDLDPIKKYQRYVNTELDYCYLTLDGNGVISGASQNVSAGTVFTSTYHCGNMKTNTDNYSVILKGGKTYQLEADAYVSGTYSHNYIYDLTNDIKVAQSSHGSCNSSSNVVNCSASCVYSPTEDCEIQIICGGGSGNVSAFYFIVKEIGHSLTIDPVEHVNTNNGLEDTPVGHIISHMGTKAPKHYLICDGSTYLITDYPYLAEHIKEEFGAYNYFGGDGETTFAVPDLRAEFLRGAGIATRNTGSGANVGEHQDGTQHLGTYIANYGKGLYTPTDGSSSINEQNPDIIITGLTGLNMPNASYGTNNSYASLPAFYTSRPTNTSVLYCIKYESTYYLNIHGFIDEKVLFEGELVSGSAELLDSIQNYDYIEVRTCHRSGGTLLARKAESIPVDEIKESYGINMSFSTTSNVSGNLNTSTIRFKFDSDTSITINDNTYFIITKVVGIKYRSRVDGSVNTGNSCNCETYTDEQVDDAISSILS